MTIEHADSKTPHTFGTVSYMDPSPLLRPQRIKGPGLIVAGAIVAASLVVGGCALNSITENMVYAEAHQQEAISKVLVAPVDGMVPTLSTYMKMGDEDIVASLQEENANLSVATQTGSKAVDAIKIGEGVDEATALKAFQSNADGLSALTTVKALHGTWRFDVDRTSGTLIRLRSVDFTSGSPDAAILTAMSQQGFSPDSVLESGLDDTGNTYRTGTYVTEDGEEYNWRISAIGLSEMYKTDGLPESAVFVGIRMSY